MKISYNWLKELANIKLTPEKTGELLTGCGLEVEGLEKYESVKGGLEGIVIGEVKTCIKHPNADKLSLTTVDVGKGTHLQIVCGAPNVAVGQKVLVATVGTIVHPTKGEPFEIKKSKIRGEVSEGMICAEDELSLGESHEGILVLPDNYAVGEKATTYFPIYSDHVLEIGLTANRGDAASHLGVARDLNALTDCNIQISNHELKKVSKATLPISVEVQNTDLCPRYSGISISGITVKESPEWLRNKLKAIGINPINNIVDATNYVLHELGQPLHAFDADKLSGNKIIVKQVAAGTKFITLDKTERILNGTECMICDAEKPVAIGGVFGGLDSGINTNTKNLFIESAFFDATSVRKTAKYHGLSTDASFRYERGTDPNMTLIALGRVANLILDIAGGEISSDVVDVYPAKIEHTVVEFSISKFNKLIGQEIPLTEVKRILTALEITITKETSSHLTLSIPPYRVDVKREADIAEEILRIYGLNKIEIPTQLKSALTRSADEDAYLLKNKIAHYLSDNGFFEMTCNSLTKSAYYPEEELNNAVRLLNPLSNDLDIMRMNMLFNGLEMIQYNLNRKSTDIKAFEYGLTYKTENGKYKETPHFSLFVTGKKHAESWNTPQKDTDFFTIKAFTENVLKRAGIASFDQEYKQEGNVHLSGSIRLTYKGTLLAESGFVRPALLKPFDIDQHVYFSDILWNNVKTVASAQKFTLVPVSSFPSVRRDLALILDKGVSYSAIEKLALKTEPKLVKNMNVFDVYEGDKIEAGKKSYAISFILQDENKTLTDQEIDATMNRFIKTFEKELGAVLRS